MLAFISDTLFRSMTCRKSWYHTLRHKKIFVYKSHSFTVKVTKDLQLFIFSVYNNLKCTLKLKFNEKNLSLAIVTQSTKFEMSLRSRHVITSKDRTIFCAGYAAFRDAKKLFPPFKAQLTLFRKLYKSTSRI